MFSFIKRFITAWKLTRDNDLMKVVNDELASRKFVQNALNLANKAMPSLIPEDRHTGRKDTSMTLNISCASVYSKEEVDKILEESRIEHKEFQIPSTGTPRVVPISEWQQQRRAMEQHCNKWEKKANQSF